MVGLRIVLENQRNNGFVRKNNPQVINKSTMISSPNHLSPPSTTRNNISLSAFPVPNFLQQCFLCKQVLLPGKDIYMYKGDRAFCSVECRCRQIFMDEEETLKKENCSLAAMRAKRSSTSSSSSSFPDSGSRHRKGARNRAGGFVY